VKGWRESSTSQNTSSFISKIKDHEIETDHSTLALSNNSLQTPQIRLVRKVHFPNHARICLTVSPIHPLIADFGPIVQICIHPDNYREMHTHDAKQPFKTPHRWLGFSMLDACPVYIIQRSCSVAVDTVRQLYVCSK
jgi:hypothetical protein